MTLVDDKRTLRSAMLAWRGALSDDERRLYELIWKRAVACQMIPATLNTVSVDLAAGSAHAFRASGTTVVVAGFLVVMVVVFFVLTIVRMGPQS